MADDPAGGPTVKNLNVAIEAASQNFTFDTTGFDATNLGWTQKELLFTASATDLNLTFASFDVGPFGLTLDFVSMVPTPEPLFVLPAGMLVVAARCRR